MKVFAVILIISLCILSPIDGLTQRGHEIQVQFGVLFNKGVSFYDYVEPGGTRRHNFEFDQKYTSNFYSVSWRYPINNYLETGLYYSHSLTASLLLLEAESILFDSEKPETRGPSPHFLGTTNLSANNREIGIDVRLTVARFNKFKTYLVLNAGFQRISIKESSGNKLEAQHPDLRQNLLKTYLVDEYLHTIGCGLGFSRLLTNGINIKIIEMYGRNHPESSLMLPFPLSLEIRTGVSYQFYKKK